MILGPGPDDVEVPAHMDGSPAVYTRKRGTFVIIVILVFRLLQTLEGNVGRAHQGLAEVVEAVVPVVRELRDEIAVFDGVGC